MLQLKLTTFSSLNQCIKLSKSQTLSLEKQPLNNYSEIYCFCHSYIILGIKETHKKSQKKDVKDVKKES